MSSRLPSAVVLLAVLAAFAAASVLVLRGCDRPLTPEEQSVRDILPATGITPLEWGPHGQSAAGRPVTRLRHRVDATGEEVDRLYEHVDHNTIRWEENARGAAWRD